MSRLRTFAVAVIATTLLAGCTSQTTRRDGLPLTSASLVPPDCLTGSINVWSWNIAAKSLQKLVPDFQRRYPHVRVNVDMTGANMQTRFMLSLSSEVGAPDISQLQLVDAPRYIETGRLTDLTAVAGRYRDQFPTALMANCMKNGRIYAIPWDMGPCAVFYKRPLFRRYGIDPDSIKTWDDYIEAGKTILLRSHGATKMLPVASGSLSSLFEILLQQNGGQVFDAQGRIAIHSPQSDEALAVIRKMIAAGICSNTQSFSQEFMAGFKDDSIATYPNAVWLGGTIKDTVQEYAGQRQDWGVFRLPALSPSGLRTSNQGGSVLVIPSSCKNKQAAWAFLEYALCTREGQLAQYRNFDLFPALLPTLSDPFFDEADPFYCNQKVRRLFATDVTRIPVLYRTSDWAEAMRYLDQSLSRWASSGMRSADVFAELERKLHRRLGRPVAPHAGASR